MVIKNKFWYESNAYFGYISDLEDLKKAIELQLEFTFNSVDEFLDRSFQHKDEISTEFGTRSEHTGEKTLRTFLKENDFDFTLIEK